VDHKTGGSRSEKMKVDVKVPRRGRGHEDAYEKMSQLGERPATDSTLSDSECRLSGFPRLLAR
jgi:hypothetical protein